MRCRCCGRHRGVCAVRVVRVVFRWLGVRWQGEMRFSNAGFTCVRRCPVDGVRVATTFSPRVDGVYVRVSVRTLPFPSSLVLQVGSFVSSSSLFLSLGTVHSSRPLLRRSSYVRRTCPPPPPVRRYRRAQTHTRSHVHEYDRVRVRAADLLIDCVRLRRSVVCSSSWTKVLVEVFEGERRGRRFFRSTRRRGRTDP